MKKGMAILNKRGGVHAHALSVYNLQAGGHPHKKETQHTHVIILFISFCSYSMGMETSYCGVISS
jgi:hypothetical protein